MTESMGRSPQPVSPRPVAPRPLSPRLSAGVITADLTRLGAELEHLRGLIQLRCGSLPEAAEILLAGAAAIESSGQMNIGA